nr:hypothetical protein [uncultured Dyadobacter sp.]
MDEKLQLALAEASAAQIEQICVELRRTIKAIGNWANFHVSKTGERIAQTPGRGQRRGEYYNRGSFEHKLRRLAKHPNQAETRGYLTKAIVAIAKGFDLVYKEGTFQNVTGIADSVLNQSQAVSNEVTTLHFVLYYWFENGNSNNEKRRVDRGYFAVSFPKNSQDAVALTALLELYHNRPSIHSDGLVAQISSESAERIEKNLIIRMRDHKNPKIVSHWIFSLDGDAPENWRLLLGTYCTVGRLSPDDKPVAGVALLEKHDTKQSCLEQMGNTPVNDAIYNFLFRSRLVVTDQRIESIEDLPNESFSEVKELAPYVGTYECHLLSGNRSTDQYLMKFVCRFHKNTNAEILLKTTRAHDKKVYQGRVRIGNNHSIICYFDLIRNRRLHRFTLYIDNSKKHVNNSLVLYGVYGGIEANDRTPIAGRIRMRLMPDSHEIPLKDMPDHAVDSIPLNDGFGNLLSDDSDLKMYLSGTHDVDYLELLETVDTDQIRSLRQQIASLTLENEELRAKASR